MASTKVTQTWPPPWGAANPKVVSEEPLTSKERSMVPALMPQKMKVKPTVTVNIHTSGRLTSETGAYSPRRLSRRSGFRHGLTKSRSAIANTAREIRVNPLRGRTTVSRAEISTAMTRMVPSTAAAIWTMIMIRPGGRRCRR